MENWTNTLKYYEENLKKKKNIHFFLLELDTIQEKLIVSGYSKRQENKAIQAYSNAEKKIYGNPKYDAVLVGADTFSDLKKAYPNYFLDTKEFITHLKKIIEKC